MSGDAHSAPTAGTLNDSENRRGRRRWLIHGTLVALDAPAIADHPWVVDAIDLNSSGMGMVLPAELAEGTEVLLSFKLGEAVEFSQLPAVVRHQLGSSGGVRFSPWPASERLKLLEWLVQAYENE